MRRLIAAGLLTLACGGRPSFSREDIDRAVLGKGLPAGFLLGTATSAHQVEGGNSNDWTDWESSTFPDGRPHIHDGTVSGIGPDSWNKFDLDPTGGDRVVHNSVEYRYGAFQIFYDSGAVWDHNETAVVRHSAGVGLRQGVFSLAVAFPLREGHIDPIFMVGMNY